MVSLPLSLLFGISLYDSMIQTLPEKRQKEFGHTKPTC